MWTQGAEWQDLSGPRNLKFVAEKKKKDSVIIGYDQCYEGRKWGDVTDVGSTVCRRGIRAHL